MPFTSYLNRSLMNNLFGAAAYTFPTNVYVGLSTTTPDGTGTAGTGSFAEVTGGSYARVTVANNTTSFGAVSAATTAAISRTNATVVTFPAATANWGTVTHVGIFDASTAGNLLAFGALTASNAISSGDTASFAVNQISFTLT
jgi:hypothetical protein